MTQDPVELTQALIRCASVTPAEGGALTLMQDRLEALGFACTRLPFQAEGTERVDNLFARIGTGGPHFCFAGHTDVVPPGERERWADDPFGGNITDGRVYGRGASDMKGAVACFAAAASRYLKRNPGFDGSISLLITGDEEGPAINGTAPVLAWMKEKGHVPDHCLVGEPSNPEALGDFIKNGRRGSVNFRLTAHGVQGHTAYPDLADNAAHRIVRILERLIREPLDEGTESFPPTNLEIPSIDVGNTAYNVIPNEARAHINIRYNDLHSAASLEAWIREQADAVGGPYTLMMDGNSDVFLTPPGDFTDLIQDAVEDVVDRRPELATTGGTSDARFIKDYCPVCEFGAINKPIHQVDEHAAVSDLEALTDIYVRVLERYFGRG
jgi:succinyl-diaminopimelate desuccinylase